LGIDLSSAFVSFAEATYGHPDGNKWDKLKVIAALRYKIMALSKLPDADAGTMEELINQLLDTVKQTKKDLNMSRWIHMPKSSEEYKYYIILCGEYEAFVYTQLGGLATWDASEEGFKIMITYFKKARAIYNLVGMKFDVSRMDTIISMYTTNEQAVNNNDAPLATITNSELEAMKKMYEHHIISKGIDSEVTIRSGLVYAKGLRYEFHCIEAERLVTKLATMSRRVHGPDHKITIDADKLQKQFMARHVFVLPDDKLFQALQYEKDGEICVVQGPIKKPRQIEEERIHNVEWNLVVPAKGCVVICHGLISASHLNGELGEVREVKTNGAEIRLAVYFEKKGAKSALVKGAKSALVKPENLRIAFELPSKD
jgi:hypothetical protein